MWPEDDIGCTPEVIFQQLRTFRVADRMLTKRILGLPRWQDPALHAGPLDRRLVDDQEHAVPAEAVGTLHQEEHQGLRPSSCVSGQTGQGTRSRAAADQLPIAGTATVQQDGSREPVAVPVIAAGPQDEDRDQENFTFGGDGFHHVRRMDPPQGTATVTFQGDAFAETSSRMLPLSSRIRAHCSRASSSYSIPGIGYGDFEHVEVRRRLGWKGRSSSAAKGVSSRELQVLVRRAAALKGRRVTCRTDVGRTSAGFLGVIVC